jgi:hypothetical protein
MTHVERCPVCSLSVVARTNGNGLAYLECPNGDWGEAITRKADPYPTKRTHYVDAKGHKRYRARGRVPQGNHMAKKTLAKAGR